MNGTVTLNVRWSHERLMWQILSEDETELFYESTCYQDIEDWLDAHADLCDE